MNRHPDANVREPARLWTADDAGNYLRLSADTVRAYARDGKIPACRVGSKVRFDPDILRRWVHEHTTLQPKTEALQGEQPQGPPAWGRGP